LSRVTVNSATEVIAKVQRVVLRVVIAPPCS
jgi:hypothetical protein